ncbi:hypothetical protein KI387_021572, partial [Taxus chinensis]
FGTSGTKVRDQDADRRKTVWRRSQSISGEPAVRSRIFVPAVWDIWDKSTRGN